MTIKHPTPELIPLLRTLWKQAFGDDDRFLDKFFSTAFSPRYGSFPVRSSYIKIPIEYISL